MTCRSALFALVLSGFLATACGDDSSDTAAGSGGRASGGGPGSTSGTGGEGASSSTGSGASGGQGTGGQGGAGGCVNPAAPPDRDRFVVVGHPYDDAAGADGSYEVLALSTTGELSTTGTRFTMGRSSDRAIVFTPDGQIGFAVQDDGSVGVFQLDVNGTVTVIEPKLQAEFYADSLSLNVAGSTLFVVDPNFPENGGGVYTVKIDCTGRLTPKGRLFDAKSASTMLHYGGGEAFVAARAVLGGTERAQAHKIHFEGGIELQGSVDVFGDDEAIVSWATPTRNRRHVLIGDNSAFSSVPNRVGIVELTASGLSAVQVLDEDIEDPFSLATSPFDDAAIVASGFENEILVLDYDGASATPFSLRGELPYIGGAPQLPGALSAIERGSLDGRVFIGDVRGLFVVQFERGGVVTDLGVFDLGGGNENIVSGVGVQP